MEPLASEEVLNIMESIQHQRLQRRNGGRPVSQSQLVAAVRAIVERSESRYASGTRHSISRLIRGISALRNQPINPETSESDVSYVRSLQTGSAPGSYLTPTQMGAEITDLLAQYESMRMAGCRVWTTQEQRLTIGGGLTNPQFVWQTEGSRQSATDSTFSQLSFNLKPLQALLLISAQLFKVTAAPFDEMLASLWSEGIAEAADQAMHATSTLANAPTALMSAAGISTLSAGGNSANGGNLAYSDLLAAIQKSADLKVRNPAWFLNGRSLLRVLSLQATTSMPIIAPVPTNGPGDGWLLGRPYFLTGSIPNTEAIGSGSNQSHILLAPPRAVHIAEKAEMEISISDEFGWDSNEIAIRILRQCDFQFAPAAGIVVLQGVN